MHGVAKIRCEDGFLPVDDPTATYLEDEYRFGWSDIDMELVLQRFREERGDLKADIQPQSMAGEGELPSEKVNLSSARSIKQYANTLGGYGLLEAEEWFEVLTKASSLAKRRYQDGEPPVVLANVEYKEQPQFVVWPYIDAHGTSILFGDGGVTKSIQALALGISVATGQEVLPETGDPYRTGPVLYIDWEADAVTHAERMAAICAGAEIATPEDIIYMARTASLSESTRELRRVIATEGVVFCIVDSVAAASGGDPEKAETVIRAFNAMRSLGVPVLALHHVTKDQKSDRTKPFGSVFAPNLARRTWRIDRDQDEGEDMVRVRLTHHKSNFGRKEKAKGYGVQFQTNLSGSLAAINFVDVAAHLIPREGGGDSMKYQIAETLKGGALTQRQIAAELDAKENTISRTLRRHSDWFIEVDGGWGLVASDVQVQV